MNDAKTPMTNEQLVRSRWAKDWAPEVMEIARIADENCWEVWVVYTVEFVEIAVHCQGYPGEAEYTAVPQCAEDVAECIDDMKAATA